MLVWAGHPEVQVLDGSWPAWRAGDQPMPAGITDPEPSDWEPAFDDLIATGGTAAAAVELIRGVGGTVVEACFVIDLPDLGGADRLRSLGCDCFSLCEFEGA